MTIDSEDKARAFCAELTDAAGLLRLETFARILIAENRRQNLIAKASEEILWTRHFADSLQLLTHVSRGTSPWLDLGTGAGFPGLLIAIARDDIAVHLVETRRKRAEFLARCVDALELSNCTVHNAKIEAVEAFPVSVISARAFAPLPKLLTLSARFSTHDTVWLLPKGRSARQEVEELPPKWRKMFHVEQSVTDPMAGILVGRGRAERE